MPMKPTHSLTHSRLQVSVCSGYDLCPPYLIQIEFRPCNLEKLVKPELKLSVIAHMSAAPVVQIWWP